ncbi:MAG: LytR C-terminal domain-containing protein [Longimicrobiales bacterium]
MSDARNRLEVAAIIAAFLLVIAFIASFLFGVVRRTDHEIAVDTPASVTPPKPGVMRGRVEVLNASGRTGLARAVTMQLRDAGFDVVNFGTTRARDSSAVIDRVGRLDIAQAAAQTLSIPRVETKRDSTLLLDATVLIGGDWQVRQAQLQVEQTRGWKARLKKWLGR